MVGGDAITKGDRRLAAELKVAPTKRVNAGEKVFFVNEKFLSFQINIRTTFEIHVIPFEASRKCYWQNVVFTIIHMELGKESLTF